MVSSVERSRVTYARNVFTAVGGAASPHTASTNADSDTDSPTRTTNAANNCRGNRPPRPTS